MSFDLDRIEEAAKAKHGWPDHFQADRKSVLALVEVVKAAQEYQDALAAAAKARVGGFENEYHQLAVHATHEVLAIKLLTFDPNLATSATAPDGASQKRLPPSPGAYEDEQKNDLGDGQKPVVSGGGIDV